MDEKQVGAPQAVGGRANEGRGRRAYRGGASQGSTGSAPPAVARGGVLPGRTRVRPGAHALERHDRPAPCGRRPRRGRGGREARGEARERERAPPRGAGRRPQHRRERQLRRRAPAGPHADEVGADRSGCTDGSCRAGRHPRRVRQGGAGVRARDAARHQLDHGSRWAHPRRRVRLAQPEARAHRRQPARGRRRHRGRRAAPRERTREPGPLLGGAGRRRELRGGDVLRVPAPPGRTRGAGRSRHPPHRQCEGAPPRVPAARGRGA